MFGIRTVRWLNVAMGSWLFLSAFLWPHINAQFTNAWLVGFACVAVALLAMSNPPVRFLNAVLALWLFVSVRVLPIATMATLLTSTVTAVVIFCAALVPNPPASSSAHRARSEPGVR